VALLGYYSGGATSAANIAQGFSGVSGHAATVALGYSGRYVASATISSMLPSVSIPFGNNFTLNVSAGVGFGSGGFVGGINVSATYSEGKNSYTFGGGFGSNYKAWGANLSFNNGAFGIGYYRTYYGSAIGPDGVSNKQIVGGLSITSNDFSFRLENDFFGDRHDRWRSGAAEIGIGDFVMGFNVYNNDVGPEAEMKEDGRNLVGKLNRPTRDGTVLGAWKNGQTYSSPLWVGVKANGQVYRFGYGHPLVQDRTQNVIHRWFGPGRTNYFNRYDNFQYGTYNYFGFYNPYSLW
jgi:hypothetical protein